MGAHWHAFTLHRLARRARRLAGPGGPGMSVRTDLPGLLADPALAFDVPPDEARRLLMRLAPVTEALRLAAAAPAASPHAIGAVAFDEMVTADVASMRTGMSKRWLYA